MDRQECLSYQKQNPLPLTVESLAAGPLRFPVVSFVLLQLSPHNQRAALMPMMVGMMVCAVVVVCAEVHDVIHPISREVFLYLTILPCVNATNCSSLCGTLRPLRDLCGYRSH
jgi:hypothetical protein